MKKITSLLPFFLLASFISNSQPCTIPDSFFADDTIIVCQGSSYQLKAPLVPGSTYTWSTAEGGTSIDITYNGKYWLQISNGVCTKNDTVTILFNSFLLSPGVNDLKLCKGSTTRPLFAQGQNILWYADAIGGTGSPAAPVPSAADTGRVIHWVSQTIRGCESPRVPLFVKVIDKPMLNWGCFYYSLAVHWVSYYR